MSITPQQCCLTVTKLAPLTPTKRGRTADPVLPLPFFSLGSSPNVSPTKPIVLKQKDSIEDMIKVHESGQFSDPSGIQRDLGDTLGTGDFMTCFAIRSLDHLVFKIFRYDKLEKIRHKIPGYIRSKNQQYEQLFIANIPSPKTIPVQGGWLQEKIPHMVKDAIHFDPKIGPSPFQMEIFRQVRDILKKAWDTKIEIDPLPRNFGYVLEGEKPVVKLFDFREDSFGLEEDGFPVSVNPLQIYLDGEHQCLDVFSQGNQNLRNFLDPRLNLSE